jgi:threonine/homoserine/homoserine lactone efflux protein
MRGGIVRGLAATAGAALALAALLSLLVLGLSIASPPDQLVNVLQTAGGLLLVWLAIEGYRAASRIVGSVQPLVAPKPWTAPIKVAIAVLIFPGTWIFVAGIGSPLISEARLVAGPGGALAVAGALVIGTVIGNAVISVLAGWGRKIASARALTTIRIVLAVVLGAIGLAMVATGIAQLSARA